MLLFGESWFPYCYSAMHTVCVQCLPDGGLINTDVTQCKSGLKVFSCDPVVCDFILILFAAV